MRGIIIVLLAAVWVAFSVWQIRRGLLPGAVRALATRIEPIHPPVVLFVAPHTPINKILVSMKLIAGVDTTVRQLEVPNNAFDKAIANRTWGIDAVYPPLVNLESAQPANLYKAVFSLSAPETWSFAPQSRFDEIGDPLNRRPDEVIKFRELRLEFKWPTLGAPGISTELELFVLQTDEQLQTARESGQPLDISLLPFSNYCFFGSSMNCRLGIRKRYYQTGGIGNAETVRYEVNAQSGLNVANDTAAFSYVMLNEPASDPLQGYVVDVMTDAPELHWLDVIGSMGGCLLLVLLLYTLLLGQWRARPWGVVQQRMLRKSVLGRYPTNVVTLAPASSTSLKAIAIDGRGRDSAIAADSDHYRRQRHHLHDDDDNDDDFEDEKSTVRFAPSVSEWSMHAPPPASRSPLAVRHPDGVLTAGPIAHQPELVRMPSADDLGGVSGVQQRREVLQIGSVVAGMSQDLERIRREHDTATEQLEQLTAFRRRMEAFYLSNDLFYKGHR